MTSDKGREKGALREIEGLLEELMGEREVRGVTAVVGGGLEGGDKGSDMAKNEGKERLGATGEDNLEKEDGQGVSVGGQGTGDGGEGENRGVEEGDIEKDILAELEEMRGGTSRNNMAATADANGTHFETASTTARAKLGLITLDIPCVSFVRLPSTSVTTTQKPVDPVASVYEICRAAQSSPLTPRSRYIKRLTPLTRVKKVMNDGLERLCEEVLPPVFGADQGRELKYAVRVTVRNNNQISREDIIKRVAGYVVKMGRGEVEVEGDEGKGRNARNTSSEEEEDEVDGGTQDGELGVEAGTKEIMAEVTTAKEASRTQEALERSPLKALEHKVDLKNFEKLVLVEIYRNVVGMSVVGEAREFEDALKRFNLAEIYAAGRKHAEERTEGGE